MSGPILVALDSGTSVVKAEAFDATGKLVAQASRANVISSGPGSVVEQDMASTWEDACTVLGELAPRLDGAEVAALAITGQGDGTWLIDRDGMAVAPAVDAAHCRRLCQDRNNRRTGGCGGGATAPQGFAAPQGWLDFQPKRPPSLCGSLTRRRNKRRFSSSNGWATRACGGPFTRP